MDVPESVVDPVTPPQPRVKRFPEVERVDMVLGRSTFLDTAFTDDGV